MAGFESGPGSAGSKIEELARRLASRDRANSDPASDEAARDRDFAGLIVLLAPRIYRLIRQYRLSDIREDAEQAAAIGVHRALSSYDPARASFSTHVTWQVRGELQSLRHRVRLDHRRSARSAGIRTVSLESLRARVNGRHEESVFQVVDESALSRTERAASDSLTRAMMDHLLDRLDAPEHERAIVYDHLFERAAPKDDPHTAEQRRQIVRRTMRNCAKVVAG